MTFLRIVSPLQLPCWSMIFFPTCRRPPKLKPHERLCQGLRAGGKPVSSFRDHVLVDRPDQRLDLVGMRSELLGELVEIAIGNLLEAGLVDIGDDLDADAFEPGRGRSLELERFFRLL